MNNKRLTDDKERKPRNNYATLFTAAFVPYYSIFVNRASVCFSTIKKRKIEGLRPRYIDTYFFYFSFPG